MSEEILTYPRICYGVWNRKTSAWIRNDTESRISTWRGLFKAIFKRRLLSHKGPTIIPFFADLDDAVLYKQWAESKFKKQEMEVDIHVVPVEIPALHLKELDKEEPLCTPKT